MLDCWRIQPLIVYEVHYLLVGNPLHHIGWKMGFLVLKFYYQIFGYKFIAEIQWLKCVTEKLLVKINTEICHRIFATVLIPIFVVKNRCHKNFVTKILVAHTNNLSPNVEMLKIFCYYFTTIFCHQIVKI